MRCRIMFAILLSATTFLGVVCSIAAPIPALDLPALVKESDIIVLGQVVSVKEEGRTTINIQGRSMAARRMVASLRADKILKGQLSAAGVPIVFFTTELPLGYQNIVATQYGMFFLRGDYVVNNPYYPFIVAAQGATAEEGDVLDRVIAHVAHVLITPEMSLDQRRQAVEILSKVETTATTEVLRRTVQSSNILLRFQAVAALLRRNDVSALNTAEEALLQPQQNTDKDLLSSLAFAIRDGIRDPRAIPSLTRLLFAPDVQTRRGAAAALRHTEIDAVIEPLSLALNDADKEVRFQAVLGLAMVTGNTDYAPSFDLYEQDEKRYLDYWRNWARKR